MKAQALWFVGPRQAELREEEVRTPTATQVQVKSICSLSSAGSELNFYRGEGNLDHLNRRANPRLLRRAWRTEFANAIMPGADTAAWQLMQRGMESPRR
jgi:hypothetical protein